MVTFKEGDLVVFVGPSYSGSFTPGQTYEVGGHYHTEKRAKGDGVGIKADNTGRENGWSAKFFELVGGPW